MTATQEPRTWPHKDVLQPIPSELQPHSDNPDLLEINIGPNHPSTHGVLRIVIELDGEFIVKAEPDIGFLHTGIEKQCEALTWQQAVTLTDRVDYLANLSNNLCYCLAVEKLLQLEIPPMAQWMRVMLVELTRLNSHLVWLGTHALDIGAMTMFLYCMREREDLQIFPPATLKLNLAASGREERSDRRDATSGPAQRSGPPGEAWGRANARGPPRRPAWWAARATAGAVTPGFSKAEILKAPAEDPRAPDGVLDRVTGLLLALSDEQ